MAKKPAYCNNKEGDPPAVRVYTVCDESRYLIVRNVPALGCVDELIKLFGLYGPIEEYRLLDEEECEPFTDVILIKFIYIGNARFAKRKLDEHPFFGNLLQVTYAPEYETLLDTKDKLEERRHTVRSRLNPSKQRGTIPQAVNNPGEPDALPESSSLPGTVWKYPKFPLEQVAVKAEETDYSASGISQCQDKASVGSMLTSQVSVVMEIPKDRFMILLKEGLTLMYRTEIKSAHFFPNGRYNLNEELALLKQYMDKNNIQKPPEEETFRPKREQKEYYQPIVKNLDPKDEIELPIGIYDWDNAVYSRNARALWE